MDVHRCSRSSSLFIRCNVLVPWWKFESSLREGLICFFVTHIHAPRGRMSTIQDLDCRIWNLPNLQFCVMVPFSPWWPSSFRRYFWVHLPSHSITQTKVPGIRLHSIIGGRWVPFVPPFLKEKIIRLSLFMDSSASNEWGTLSPPFYWPTNVVSAPAEFGHAKIFFGFEKFSI